MNKEQKEVIQDFLILYMYTKVPGGQRTDRVYPIFTKDELTTFLRGKKELIGKMDADLVIDYLKEEEFILDFRGDYMLTKDGHKEAKKLIKYRSIIEKQKENNELPVRSRNMIKVHWDGKAYRILPGKYTIMQPARGKQGKYTTKKLKFKKDMVVNKSTQKVFRFDPNDYAGKNKTVKWNNAIKDAERYIKFYEELVKDTLYHPETKFYLFMRSDGSKTGKRMPAVISIMPLMAPIGRDDKKISQEIKDEKDRKIKIILKKYKLLREEHNGDMLGVRNWAIDEKGDVYYVDLHIFIWGTMPKDFKF